MSEYGVKRENKALIVLVACIPLFLFLTIGTYIASHVSAMYNNGIPKVFGASLISIQTNTMEPTLNPGDLAIIMPVNSHDLREDDIITYWTIIDNQMAINTHRVTAVYESNSGLIFETKGDNNTSVDLLHVKEKEIIGKYVFKIPFLGTFYD